MANKREILAGATDQTIDVFLEDVNGSPLTGLAFNSSGLTCYYRKGATGSATALTLATQTVGGAHSDGGFVQIDATNMPGVYRLDLSDTIVATAGAVYLVINGYAGLAPCVMELEIGRAVASVVGAVGSVTGAVGSVTGAVGSVTGNVGGNVTGSVGSVATGGIAAASFAAGAIDAAAIAANAIDRATFAADTGLQSIRSNTAQSATGTTIVLDASASAVDDFYNSCIIYITGGTGVGQARAISDYVGSTKTATVSTWATTPDNTSTFAILPDSASAGGGGGATAQEVWEYTTRTLTSVANITVQGAVASGGDVQIYGGYDYTDESGTVLEWALTGAPILTGATVDVVHADASETSYGWTITVTNGNTTSPTIKAELTGTQSAALKAAGITNFPFRIKATLSNAAQCVLVDAVLRVR